MPYFGVDDGFAFHPKAVHAGNAALGLWVRAGAWCNQQLTDGFVPHGIVATLGTTAQAKRLVSVGLWITADGGYQFHQWTDQGRNFSRADVLAKREKDKKRKAGSKAVIPEASQVTADRPLGIRSDSAGNPDGVHVDSACPIPSHPIPSLSSPQVEREGSPTVPRDSPRPPERCQIHLNEPYHTAPCGGCADARRALRTWEIQTEKRRKWVASEIQIAKANPDKRCEHGTDGGLHPHPDTGQSATCALCRRGNLRSVS